MNKVESVQKNSISYKIIIFFGFFSVVTFIIYSVFDHFVPTKNLERIHLKRPIFSPMDIYSKRKLPLDITWIKSELNSLSSIVQEKLNNLQRNQNCEGPLISCGHYSNCGFGCHVHHRILCLVLSFTLNRPIILETETRLSYTSKWNEIFQPIGVNCTKNNRTYGVLWRERQLKYNGDRNILYLSKYINENIQFPSQLLERLKLVHSEPFAWFVGQLATVTLRLIPSVQERIDSTADDIEFDKPIVGIHIRRTDKLEEKPFSYHPIEQYMLEAERYFTKFHPNVKMKRIFLATEDLKVFEEVKQRYVEPEWKIIGFPPERTTLNLKERVDFMFDIIRVVILLSRCQFIICGFSSNICRLVYELSQFQNEDESTKVLSLDTSYYYNVLGKAMQPKLVGTSNVKLENY